MVAAEKCNHHLYLNGRYRIFANDAEIMLVMMPKTIVCRTNDRCRISRNVLTIGK